MNLEAIKAAIAWFENQRDGYDDARKRAIANGAMSSTIKSAEIIMTSIDTALAALRECAERREGRADVAPVVHGEWILVCANAHHYDISVEEKCSVCGRYVYRYDTQPQDNFCPSCGARMDGGT